MSEENLIDELEVAAKNAWRDLLSLFSKETGVVPYNELPQAPAGPGDDSHVKRSLEDLEPWARASFLRLETRFAVALGPIGMRATRSETKRTQERQAWLWGIGRTWQAPGRDGIVTNAQGASGPHVEGRAVDYDYVPLPDVMGPPDAADLMAALKGVADAARADGLEWGGEWVTLVDPRHWEMKEG